MTRSERLLQLQATRLLRRTGFTWSGRKRGEVAAEQREFETRMVRIPTNGKPRRREHAAASR